MAAGPLSAFQVEAGLDHVLFSTVLVQVSKGGV